MKEIFTAKKLEDAKRQAVQTFGVEESQIVFRILEQKKGVFGMGASVKIEAIYEPLEETAAPKAAAATETAPAATPEVQNEVLPEAAAEEAETAAPATEATEAESAETTAIILTDEQAASIEKVKAYIIAVYEKLGVTVSIDVKPQENGVLLELQSANRSGTIIGRRGETLDSIQYLSSIIANKGEEEYCRVILDSNGYREKRRQTLEQLAERLAKNAIRTKRSTTLEPMNPYERRIIHAKVAEIEGVSSRSVGEDPYRKVVILPLDEKGEPIQNHRPRGGKGRGNSGGGKSGGNGNYRGNRKKGGNRSSSEPVRKPTNFDDIMSTSFEKDYRKPKPEDELTTGLYGKIEL